MKKLLVNVNRCIRSIPNLGPWAVCKLAFAMSFPVPVKIRPQKNLPPVLVRGRTSDTKILYSIFARDDYPAFSGEGFDTIIDCGANVGFSTIYFHSIYPSANIIAIEPDRSNFEQLRKNTKHLKSIELIEAGVWSKDTNLFCTNPDAADWAFEFEECESASESTVRAIGIANLFEGLSPRQRVCIKLDIEGAEKKLFQNDPSWLARVDLLYIEIHGCWKEVFDALSNYNYRVLSNGNNLMIELEHDTEPGTQPNQISA